MNNRTELTAGLTGLINGAFVLLNATGAVHLSPELIGGINGMLLPMALFFLGNRVTRVEQSAASTEMTTNRIEAAQPKV